jgi:plastocyanin
MKINLLKDEQTALAILAIILAFAALWAVGCGGGSGYSSTPTTPTTTTPGSTTPAGAVTMNIVGLTGSAAFSPNPIQAASGATIVWKNMTTEPHHLVMDNGTVIGDVAGGASLTSQVQGSGGNFHCTNHPTMVGSINGTSAPPDPMPNPSGGYNY